MSYILDALRRADAERELGAVPSLHAQADARPGWDDGFESPPDRSWRWVAVVSGVLAAGLAVWLFLGQRASEPRSASVSAPPMVPTVAESPLLPTPLPPVELRAASAPVLQPPVEETPVIAAPEQPQKKATTLASASAASAGVSKKAPALATPPADPKKPTKAVAAVPQDAVVTLNDLPDAIRREQPKLTIGGAMHSANAANRMLILNGQVFHEGDQVTADLVLEQIKLKSAVLVYKGYRYSINY